MPPRRFRATKATRRRRAVHRLVWLRLLTKTRNKHLRPEICRDAVRAEILNHFSYSFGRGFRCSPQEYPLSSQTTAFNLLLFAFFFRYKPIKSEVI